MAIVVVCLVGIDKKVIIEILLIFIGVFYCLEFICIINGV